MDSKIRNLISHSRFLIVEFFFLLGRISLHWFMNHSEISSLVNQWRSACRECVKTVSCHVDGWIFHKPVFETEGLLPSELSAYALNVKRPIDLRTIKSNLPLYPSPEHFANDMELMFSNCLSFNQRGQDAYTMGEAVKRSWEESWMRYGPEAQTAYQRGVALGYQPDLDGFETWKFKPPGYDLVRGRPVPAPRPKGKVPDLWSVRRADASTGLRLHIGGLKVPPESPRPNSVTSHASENHVDKQSPTPSDWRLKLNSVYLSVAALPCSRWFFRPVCDSKLPLSVIEDYYLKISDPMDLTCVRMNIPRYPSPAEFLRDINLIVENCLQYNPPGDVVHSSGETLSSEFRDIWRASGVEEAFRDAVIKGYEPVWQGERARPKLPNVIAPTATWRTRLLDILCTLKEAKNEHGLKLSFFFNKPLQKYLIDDMVKVRYYETIKAPMDLSTIKSNIPLYPNPNAFAKDVKLVFSNCRAFNKQGDEIWNAGLALEAIFDRLWVEQAQGILDQWKREDPDLVEHQQEAVEEFDKLKIKPEPFAEALLEIAKKRKRHIDSLVGNAPKVSKREVKCLEDEWFVKMQQMIKEGAGLDGARQREEVPQNQMVERKVDRQVWTLHWRPYLPKSVTKEGDKGTCQPRQFKLSVSSALSRKFAL